MNRFTKGRRLAGAALAGLLLLSACGKPGAKSEGRKPGDPPGDTGAPVNAAPPAPAAETLPGRVPVFAGTYTATFPAADAPGRTVTLTLKADMSATLSMAFAGKGEPDRENGHWSFHGDEITLDLDAQDDSGPPMPLIWRVKENRLVPKAWSHARYGATGLPLEKQP